MTDKILCDLVDDAPYYDLEGVEFTLEDVDFVKTAIDNGTPYEQAIQECLEGIAEVLNN